MLRNGTTLRPGELIRFGGDRMSADAWIVRAIDDAGGAMSEVGSHQPPSSAAGRRLYRMEVRQGAGNPEARVEW